MSTDILKHEKITRVSYETDDLWAVVNVADDIICVGVDKHRTQKSYVLGYEELTVERKLNIAERFDILAKENDEKLVQLNSTYTVERGFKGS